MTKHLIILLLAISSALLALMGAAQFGSSNIGAQAILSLAFALFMCMFLYSITDKNANSVVLIFAFYHLFMFILPGMLHSAQGWFPFYEATYPPSNIIAVALMILTYTASFFLGFCVRANLPIKSSRSSLLLEKSLSLSEPLLITSCLLIIVLSIGCIAVVGIDTFITRRGDIDIVSATPAYLIMSALPRIGSFICLVLLVDNLNRGRTFFRVAVCVCGACFAFFANFPLGATRFILLGETLIAMYVFMDLSRVKVKLWLGCGLIVGIFTIFPFSSFIARGDLQSGYQFSPLEYFAQSGDFDGMQSTLNVYALVESEGFHLGWQMLSALFSYVPREVWSTKGYPTGVAAGTFMRFDFTNLSAPLVAEIFVDFGWPGLLIFPMGLGYALRDLDNRSKFIGMKKRNVISKLLYGGSIGFSIIISRGALISILSPIYLYYGMLGAILLARHRMSARQ